MTVGKYELISFDLDGTLIDSAAEIVEAANRALHVQGIPRREAAEIVRLIGSGTRELILELLARSVAEHPALLDRVRAEELLASMDQQYALVTGRFSVLYPGCREALASVRSAGLQVVCVTNKELRHAERLLEVNDLAHSFDLVIGGDSLAQKKPHGSVLRHVAQVLNADPGRSVHLGDSAVDVAAARNSGFTAWAVSYGYNAGVPIAASHPDRIFDSLTEVAAHVRAA